MFETLFAFFQSSDLAGWGLFALLVLCGLGLPLPEDIVLVTAGALSAARGESWFAVTAAMYAGVMIGDSTIFLAGRRWGPRIRRARFFQKTFSAARQAAVEERYARHGAHVLFWARFLPGLRMPVFFTAGSMRVSYAKLLVFDGAAALLSVPAFIGAGRWIWVEFEDNFEEVSAFVARMHSLTLAGTVGLITAAVLVFWLRRRGARGRAGVLAGD